MEIAGGNSSGEVTRLLQEVALGHRGKLEQLFPIIYEQLRQLAHAHFAREGEGHILQPTALVHEAYVRLFRGNPIHFQDRRHFLNVASRAMERILIEDARSRGRRKRGGDARRLDLDPEELLVTRFEQDLVSMSNALRRYESEDPRGCLVVRYRFYAQLPLDQIAEVLGVDIRTVSRELVAAKRWLRRELLKEES